jgi:excisionase family DNA binding protein
MAMKTLHLDPTARDGAALVAEEVERLLGEGKRVAVTVAEERELLSPQQAADRLGFSRQHVVRLIDAGELEGQRLPGSSYRKIPLSSVLALEERRAESDRRTAQWSRELDAVGAPPE